MASSQEKAIYAKMDLGRQIQRDFPTVGEDFLRGDSHNEIIARYNLNAYYGHNRDFLRGGLHYAIHGAVSSTGQFDYQGLATKKEIMERNKKLRETQGSKMNTSVTEKMLRANGEYSGNLAVTNETGIFSPNLTQEEQLANASKGGKESYSRGLGIHNQQNRDNPKRKEKAATESLAARGLVAWNSGEEGLLYVLGTNGFSKEEMAYYLNQLWHDGEKKRTIQSISCRLTKVRRKGSLQNCLN